MIRARGKPYDFQMSNNVADIEWTNINILYFPDSIEIISIEELGLWCLEILVPVFASSNTEIFMAQ